MTTLPATASGGRLGAGRRKASAVALGLVVVAVAVAALAIATDPLQLALVVLNGLTAAALYFLVASGYTLIFGLLRVTNLAHGALYLLGGYIGWQVFELTQNWFAALAGAAIATGILGVILQRVLMPIYGQELREALITLGVGIIIGDQIIGIWGGQAKDILLPAALDGSTALVGDLIFPTYRLVVMGIAVAIGAFLWALLRFTKLGMTVRAGVDDRNMVAATGVNILVLFAAVFAFGAALAGASGVIGGSYLSLQPGEDSRILLYSLVVVIVGGLGSVAGAALGSLLVGLTYSVGAYYVPTWSVLITFGLLVLVLIVRPHGLLGRKETEGNGEAGMAAEATRPLAPRTGTILAAVTAVAALALPLVASEFVVSQVATKALWVGIAGLSLVFLASSVGMVSMAQAATYGVAGYVTAILGVRLGLDPLLAAGLGVLAAVLFGVLTGLLVARSRGVYLLMLTLAIGVLVYYFALQAREITAGFGGIANIEAPVIAGVDLGEPVPLYYVALVIAAAVYAGLRYLPRTPLGLAFQGVRDSDRRLQAIGYNTIRTRVTAFAIAGLIAGIAGVLSVWYNGQISPGSIDLQRTINLLVIVVIGGLYRVEGAFIGAIVFTLLDTYTDQVSQALPVLGPVGRVNTLIGAFFVLALVASPGGIAGAYGRTRTWWLARRAGPEGV